MRLNRLLAVALVTSALSGVQVADAQNVGATGDAVSTATNAAVPVVADQAERLLRQMGEYVGSADQFTFHADITFDHVLPSGQKLQYAASEDVALERPDRLYVEWSGDLGERKFWYDGKSVTLYDPATPFYSTARLRLRSTPCWTRSLRSWASPRRSPTCCIATRIGAVRGNVQYGFDLGKTEVNGRSCHALAFVEKDIDWQIWIDDGPQLTPCKLVITYKTQPSQPQFTAVFTDWDFAPRIAAPVFTPEMPAGLQKIPFETVRPPGSGREEDDVKRVPYRQKRAGVLLASAALAACLVIGVEHAAAFRGGFGGFHGGGFGGYHGGGSHFGGFKRRRFALW